MFVYSFMVNSNLAFLSYNHLIFDKIILEKDVYILAVKKIFGSLSINKGKKLFHFFTLQDCLCQMAVRQEKDPFISRNKLILPVYLQ